ncbi:MAG TPA: DUF4293 family protein [Chitinophagaceae bacterium]|jgi:drug/metabolite transporter (DMT)-like permease|nr:DUF4293 family protein [Chitinophagaceae bacterium]
MIQRIQTLWLLLAAACAFLTFKFSFYSGTAASNNTQLFLNASTNMLLTVLTAILGLGSLVIIFLYKQRKIQLRSTLAAILIAILILVIDFSLTKKFSSGTYSLTAVFSFVSPVLLILAARGIWKDEKLVKSLDRLR